MVLPPWYVSVILGGNKRSLERDGIEGETPVCFKRIRPFKLFLNINAKNMGVIDRVGLLDIAALNGW